MPSPADVKFSTRVYPLRHLKLCYLKVPKAVVKRLGDTFNQRLLCSVGDFSWQCGLVALEKGDAYISLNKRIMKQLDLSPGSEVTVKLVKDTSKYGMKMSAELKTLLEQDKEGHRRFHLLSPGKQRYIIYFVAQVKSTQLRIDRAIRVIGNLKGTREGKESFREILSP